MCRRSMVLAALVAGACWVMPTPGWAVSNPHPEPPRRLTIQANLLGKLGRGAEVRFTVVATDPSGWPDLNTLRLVLLLHGQPIQQITFSVADGTLGTTGQRSIHFPGQVTLPGSFLEVFPKVDKAFPPVLHQTFSITLNIWTRVREAIPGSTVVRVVATNDQGRLVYARVKASVSAGLLSWGTFALAAAVALFIGGFVGNTFTHRRYRQREPSIWDIVERRLKEQKARPPASVLAGSDGGSS